MAHGTIAPSFASATSASGVDWSADRGASADALPYVDDASDEIRARVDQLVAEETRRMPKKVRDYLDALAPTRASSIGDDTALGRELARAGAGEAGAAPDASRYRLDPPSGRERASVEAWEGAVANAMAQLEHQGTRIVNLELGMKYAPASWRARNAWAEATLEAYEEELARAKTAVNEMNVRRKLQQEAALKEFGALEREWYATTRKCAAIEGAIADLESRLEAARRGE